MTQPDPVVIEPYNEEWQKAFHTLESILSTKLGALALRIEHVGSTSVPNLAAKPIIDIDVVIESTEQLPQVIEKLNALGYIHEGNLGIKSREAFARKDAYVPYSHDGDMKYEHHLYVCDLESSELKKHLKFRDLLREHPSLVEEYSTLKSDLSAAFRNDRQAYTQGKTEFITKVMNTSNID
ncbi:GrpB family protein [Saccharibacillus sp. JS10]|uniref:GrpB family protein n=1 Tax=Saccharibacillus sp. JS10 TaxID=2950552 RepID=UPI00210E3C15|nr:GrpB family protein [Saccharibacillus sp. JS10]MCQ4088399.1 GrpB family protein [Saccharibacillus sp. JS10]